MIDWSGCAQRIIDGNAVPLSLVGMAIVFVALLFISVFIETLPKILKVLGLFKDDEEDTSKSRAGLPEDQVIAAIGAVLRYRIQGGK